MSRSFISQLGQQTADHALDKLHRVAQTKAQDLEMKPKRDTLNKFFPEEVSNLILQLPERDQWSAIQQLAQGYGQEQGGNQDQGMEQIRQQGQLGPQGSNAVDQQLQQAMGRSATQESQGMPLAQQVQQPAKTNQEIKIEKTAAHKLSKALTPQVSKKEVIAEQNRIDKELKPYITKLRTEKDAADFSQPRLNKMKQLIKKGDLPVSSYYKILKNVEDHVGLGAGAGAGAAVGGAVGALGGPIGITVGGGLGAAIGAGLGALIGPVASLLRHGQKAASPDTEAFEKLSAGFLRGAKDIFGGRFTNEEMKAYLESIPTLAQTDKGKLDVINDMELFNKAAKIKYNSAQKIIKANGGRPPINLAELVEEDVSGKLDKLSDIFREDFTS